MPVGGGAFSAGGSCDVGFPQRSYVVLLLNITAAISFVGSTWCGVLSERCSHEKQKPEV